MTVRAVLFDLDDTLMEEEAPLVAAFRAACAPVAERHGILVDDFFARARVLGREAFQTAPAIDYLRAIDAGSSDLLSADYDADAPHAEAMAEWLTWYRRGFFRNGLRAFGIDNEGLVDEMLERYLANRHAHHRVYPETFDVLDTLAGRIPLVLVTNGPGHHQRTKLEAVGFGPYFANIVVSGEVGISKPDKRMFDAALNAVRVRPVEAIMVGNNLPRDIGGAQARGIAGAWVNRIGEIADGVKPTWEITDLREVLALVE
jgi:putative hydrolase of the HAD superfamily